MAEPRTAKDWSAAQYLKFEGERTRPSRDLLAHVPLDAPQRVVDLGCGPGNSTELLIERFPGAEVIGVDSSLDMLRQARQRLPRCKFIEADLAAWTPEPGTDLLFSNAVFHWVPDHPNVLKRLGPGGVLAVQMPDNANQPAVAATEKLVASRPWAGALAQVQGRSKRLLPPEEYYDLFRPLCRYIDIWHIHYNHLMASHADVAEWFKGSGLRPLLTALDAPMREAFLSKYIEEITRAYPLRRDGKVMLRFPRLFIVAVRGEEA
jgi:trans-aconitate 2-methyltransferase